MSLFITRQGGTQLQIRGSTAGQEPRPVNAKRVKRKNQTGSIESLEEENPDAMESISLLRPGLIPGPFNLPVTMAYEEDEDSGVEINEFEKDVSQTASRGICAQS